MTTDPRAVAAVYVSMLEGPVLLHDQVSRALGTELSPPAARQTSWRGTDARHARADPAHPGRAAQQ
jgi:hypothetical protein